MTQDKRSRLAGMPGASIRGVAAAMTMTGMRSLTADLGLIEATPPEIVVGRRASHLLERLPAERRKAVLVLMHWAYGAGGGAIFAVCPDRLRQAPWAGPLFGLALWLGFEALLDPALGLKWHRRGSMTERTTLAADHLLYGAVLAGFRRRPD
ncbi:MAG: hypothetical protein ACRDMV_10095 [Streptosporangiales bacterium]